MKRYTINILGALLLTMMGMNALAQTSWDFTTVSSADQSLLAADESGNWMKDSKNRFSHDEMEQIECILEDIYPEGMDETALNDLFWFEPECLCEWLDIDFEEWVERPDDYWVNSWRN